MTKLDCHLTRNQRVVQARQTRRMMYILQLGGRCMDCGFNDLEHPECFDFDHRDPSSKHTKLKGRLAKVALTNFSNRDLEAEMAKCDLVCANCHRIRTRRVNTVLERV